MSKDEWRAAISSQLPEVAMKYWSEEKKNSRGSVNPNKLQQRPWAYVKWSCGRKKKNHAIS